VTFLKAMTTDQLWERRSGAEHSQVRSELMRRYFSLAQKLAAKLKHKLPNVVDVEDLTMSGCFGLADAVENFDPSRRIKFETYASRRITGAMIDGLRSMDWIPRRTRTLAAQLPRATAAMTKRLGRPPTDAEIATELKTTVSELPRIRRSEDAQCVSLSTEVTRSQNRDRDVLLATVLVDPKGDELSETLEQRESFRRRIAGLSRYAKAALLMYFEQELTMKQIGKGLGLSESRISQIIDQALRELRARGES
jgi:RNA polymerase sigma factor for flagellar operon FliA